MGHPAARRGVRHRPARGVKVVRYPIFGGAWDGHRDREVEELGGAGLVPEDELTALEAACEVVSGVLFVGLAGGVEHRLPCWRGGRLFRREELLPQRKDAGQC